jgi:type I restriction enzyme R subunit
MRRPSTPSTTTRCRSCSTRSSSSGLEAAISYQAYLAKIAERGEAGAGGAAQERLPREDRQPRPRALYDQLNSNEALALSVDHAVRHAIQDDWRNHTLRTRKVFLAIKALLQGDEA